MAQQTLHAWSTLRLHDLWTIPHHHAVSAEEKNKVNNCHYNDNQTQTLRISPYYVIPLEELYVAHAGMILDTYFGRRINRKQVYGIRIETESTEKEKR